MEPRMVVPGFTWAVTCRTNDRRFFLLPERKIRDLFAYAVGYAQQKNPGVKVIAMQVMSNHYHLIVEDTLGTLPHFMQELNRMVAQAINSDRRRKGSIWGREPASWIRICTDKALFNHVNYILMNCVTAGLVRSSKLWEGFNTVPDMMGKTMVIKRPEIPFFSKRSKAPECVDLKISVPSGFASEGAKKWREKVAKRLEETEKEIQKEKGRNGFLGMARVKSIEWGSFPKNKEELRKTRPKVMSDNSEKGKAARENALIEYGLFHSFYRSSLIALINGLIPPFPLGAYRWPKLCALDVFEWRGRDALSVSSPERAYGEGA